MSNELKAEACELVEHWFPKLKPRGLWGDLRQQLKSAAYQRVLADLPRFDPAKSKLSSWVYAQVDNAIKDEQRNSDRGVISSPRGKSMPVNVVRIAGVGMQGDGDSIQDYAKYKAPGAMLSKSVVGSELEPVWDFYTTTRSAVVGEDAIKVQARADSESRDQAPAAWRRQQKEVRIHVEGDYHNEKEHFLAALRDSGMPEQEFFALWKGDGERRVITPLDKDFISYRDRVEVNAANITTWVPSASSRFINNLTMLSSILGEFVLKDTTKATAVHIGLDLQKHLIAAGFSVNERRQLVADLFRLTKRKAQEWLRYPMCDNYVGKGVIPLDHHNSNLKDQNQ